MNKEIWKDVVGFENCYQVSNLGNVKSLDRKVNHPSGGLARRVGIELNKITDKDGYFNVNLKRNQKANTSRIHRLVAIAFIPNPENKPQVNHINGIKNDNRVENLEWATLSENRQHAYDTGLQHSYTRQGENNNFTKLTKEQVIEIRCIYKKGVVTYKEISEKYNVAPVCIGSIIRRQNWKHI